MSIKVSAIKEFAFAWLMSIVTIVLCYQFHGVSYSRLYIACADAFIKSFVLVYVLFCIEKATHNRVYTGAAFLLYVTVLYNQNSVTKYAVDSLYDGSISDVATRFWGSLYINLIIIASASIWCTIHRKSSKRNFIKYDYFDIYIPKYILCLFLALYTLSQLSSVVTAKVALNNNVSRTMMTFVNAFSYITYAMVILNLRRKDNSRKLNNFLPVAFICCINLCITLITGTKSYLIIFVVVIICGLLFTNNISNKKARYVAYLAPIAMQLITIVSEFVSNRLIYYTPEFILRYHVFRFDLSDFAMTIAGKFSHIQNPMAVINEAFAYSIPSVLASSKIDSLDVYMQQMSSVGLSSMFDYNDTFFSMGAQVAGYAGIGIVFFAILMFYEWISIKIISLKKIGPAIFLVLISYFSTCEADWAMFVYNTRDILIYIVLSYALFGVFLKKKKKRKRS